jgi:predicted nucleic acid-binding protein
VASLIDTNLLVYLHDPRFHDKQAVAERLLRDGLTSGSLVLPHQAIVEFVAATTRPLPAASGSMRRRGSLLTRAEALREAEDLVAQFPVLYPDEAVLRTAMRGAAAYQLSWFDAHLWAYAEVNGLPEILSEDFEHGRRYGSVRANNPFLAAADEVHELPALYDG